MRFGSQIKAALLGLSMIGLVSANAIVVNRALYLPAFVLGCLISSIWVSGVNHVVNAKWSVKIFYVVGAGIGSVVGILIANAHL